MAFKLGHFDVFDMLFPFLAFLKVAAHDVMKSRSRDGLAAKSLLPGAWRNGPLVPVRLMVDNTIYRINHYPEDKCYITNCPIHWIAMNPKDGVVHLSNNSTGMVSE